MEILQCISHVSELFLTFFNFQVGKKIPTSATFVVLSEY